MKTCHLFNLDKVDASWQSCITQGLSTMDSEYLAQLSRQTHWLPGAEKIFNAFTLPVNQVNYILLGESPYPRAQSANGYAFWDAAVTDLWSATGLSKSVNRATSLRNIIKMLLVAEDALKPPHTSQADIMQVDKNNLVKTNHALFNNFLQRGFLLLNASLVLQPTQVRKDAVAWQPFLQTVFAFLQQERPKAPLILLGNIAASVKKLLLQTPAHVLCAEHPYNISFIYNPIVLGFFKPLQLLKRT